MKPGKKKEKKISVKHVSDASSLGMFNLDALISIELAIKHAQHSMWKALKGAVQSFSFYLLYKR